MRESVVPRPTHTRSGGAEDVVDLEDEDSKGVWIVLFSSEATAGAVYLLLLIMSQGGCYSSVFVFYFLRIFLLVGLSF